MSPTQRYSIVLGALALLAAGCGKPHPGVAAIGEACTVNGDCQSPMVCLDGKCSSTLGGSSCTAGQKRCNGGDVESCNDSGTGFTFLEACGTHQCSNGACLKPVCTPGDARCATAGAKVEACLPDGSGYVVVQVCAQACANALCTAANPVCAASEKRCNGDALEQCTTDRTAWGFVQFCSAGCDSNSNSCKAPACLPYSERCNPTSGEHETCNASGTAYVAAACSISEACSAGKCVPRVCVSSDKRCLDPVTKGTCNASGTGFDAAACASNEICQGGSCLPVVCSPMSAQCKDVSTAQVCSAAGTGWVDVACGTGNSCSGGLCQASSGASCTANSTRCLDSITLATCAANGSGYGYSACAANSVCSAGQCKPVICSPGSSTCGDATHASVCNAEGTATSSVACGSGQACDATAGACKPTICTPAATYCLDASTLSTCNATGTGYSNAGCGGGKACTGGACKPTVCVPYSSTCADSTHASVCDGTGTSTSALDCSTSGKVCVSGVCQSPGSIICVAGSYQCNGNDVQQCKPDGTAWTYLQSCTSSCSKGVCASSACKPFTLTAAQASLPADAKSSTLVVSGVIADVDGVPVPNGTLFTVSSSNSSAVAIIAADADPNTPGIQVAAANGKLDFSVQGGAAGAGQSATLSATTLTASTCAATTTVSLAAVGATAFVSEDFTTTTYEDAANTTASWVTYLGEATRPFIAGLGNGEDGDLAGSFNINTQSNPAKPSRTFPDAVSFSVTALGANTATVNALPAGLAAGDEIVLINLQGNPTTAVGCYELLTIASVNIVTNVVTFTSPVVNVYGATSNSSLAGQTVMLQRVPHYGNVTVYGQLLANPWNGKTGGLFFIKANGTVMVGANSSISMSASGYRTGNLGDGEGINGSPGTGGGACGSYMFNGYCNCDGGGGYGTAGGTSGLCSAAGGATYGDSTLTGLFLGAGGGAGGLRAGGGGIIVVWASTIGVVSSGGIQAGGSSGTWAGAWASAGSSAGSAGGSIYLRANVMNLGTGAVLANGGAGAGSSGGGGAGRIRLDAGLLHAGDTTDPAFYAGLTGTPLSKVVTKTLFTTAKTVTKGRILQAVSNTTGGTIFYELSGDGGTNWYAVDTAGSWTPFITTATDLRLRITLSGDGTNRPLGVQGVSVEFGQ